MIEERNIHSTDHNSIENAATANVYQILWNIFIIRETNERFKSDTKLVFHQKQNTENKATNIHKHIAKRDRIARETQFGTQTDA